MNQERGSDTSGHEGRLPGQRSSHERNPLAFFRGFLRQPRQVGSLVPSSRYLERRVIEAAGISHARLVVELGSGTGGMTRAILAQLPADSRLLAIEVSPHFAELVGRIEDPRLVTHTGSAEDLAGILSDRGLGSPDVVVSGIPFSTMPRSTGLSIARAIHASLTARGCFVAYQLSRRVAEIMTPIMGQPDVSIVLRNIPPMRVYRWHANS